jgi:crotonobetainyl-CoA:carnitine CoA-transferase CaiB-like acyl-CoA transferase
MRGTRVLDLSVSLAGAYCTRLFATAGSDVVVAEPPAGSPLRHAPPRFDDDRRSAAWEYLQAYKRGVVLDPDGPDVEQVAPAFDVVVTSFEGDAPAARRRADRLRALAPRLVVVVLSPFGLTGPYASYKAGPLEDWAAGGYLYLNGEPDREPLPGGGPWASYLTGATAAVGAQAALARARRWGRGDVVDVGAMEAIACAHQWSVALYTHQGVVKRRWGNRHGEAHHPLALFPCSDGWVCIASVSRHQWEGLCLAMDRVELLADDDLYVPAARFDRADELDAIISDWTSRHRTADVVDALQANQCPAGVVRDLVDTLADPHLAVRRYWAPAGQLGREAAMPGALFTVGDDAPYRPAPQRGEHQDLLRDLPGPGHVEGGADAGSPGGGAADHQLPLRGLRVIEFSVAWAGPLAGRFLADLGADVIKIEHPTSRGLSVSGTGRGDGWDPDSWQWGSLPPPEHRNGVYPQGDPGEHWWNRLGYFNKINRGKRSLCLDVKAPGGQEILDELVRRADVVVNNYSPRGVRSLGIDHPSLRALNPDLVTVDLSGFGAVGPAAEQVSWGPILDAVSGLASTTGYPDSGPYKQGLALADAAGGVHGAFAVLAALREREVTGGPVHVDVSQLQTMIGLAGDLVLHTSIVGRPPPRRGARSADVAPQGVYRTAGDDQWLALTVGNDEEWRALVAVVGEGLAPDEWRTTAGRLEGHDRIDAELGRWLAGRDKHEATRILQQAGVAAFPVMSNKDLVESPHLAARGFMVTLDHVDCGPLAFPGFPIHFDEGATDLRASPALGAHNTEILHELGASDATIAELIARGTIAGRPPA